MAQAVANRASQTSQMSADPGFIPAGIEPEIQEFEAAALALIGLADNRDVSEVNLARALEALGGASEKVRKRLAKLSKTGVPEVRERVLSRLATVLQGTDGKSGINSQLAVALAKAFENKQTALADALKSTRLETVRIAEIARSATAQALTQTQERLSNLRDAAQEQARAARDRAGVMYQETVVPFAERLARVVAATVANALAATGDLLGFGEVAGQSGLNPLQRFRANWSQRAQTVRGQFVETGVGRWVAQHQMARTVLGLPEPQQVAPELVVVALTPYQRIDQVKPGFGTALQEALGERILTGKQELALLQLASDLEESGGLVTKHQTYAALVHITQGNDGIPIDVKYFFGQEVSNEVLRIGNIIFNNSAEQASAERASIDNSGPTSLATMGLGRGLVLSSSGPDSIAS